MPSGPTTGNSSFFTACDAGKWRVPSPAIGTIALRVIGATRGDPLPRPTPRTEQIPARAKLHCTRRCALENVRHHADSARVLHGDLRHLGLERIDVSKDRHGSARAAAGDLGAVEPGLRSTLSHCLDEKIHFVH